MWWELFYWTLTSFSTQISSSCFITLTTSMKTIFGLVYVQQPNYKSFFENYREEHLEPRLARRRQMASRDTMEVSSCFTWVTCEDRALQENPSWQRHKKIWCKIPNLRTSRWARFLRFVRCGTLWAVLYGSLSVEPSAMSPFWHTGRLWCLSRLS